MRLPDSWVEARLDEVCVLNPRLPVYERPDDIAQVSFAPMSAVDEASGTISKLELRTFGEVAKGYTSFREGDVLFAKVTPCMENGKAAIAGPLMNGLGFGSTEFHVLRPTKAVLAEYLFHFIRQPVFRDRAASAFVGTGGLQRVPSEFLARVKLSLPTLPEQQRIVDVLRQAELIGEIRYHAQSLVDRLAKQRFAKMFGHPAENPKGFESLPFQDFGTLDRGISKHRPRDAEHLLGGPYPLIQTGDVSNAGDWITTYKSTYSEAGLAQSKLWPKGTLCITIAANIAKAAILEFDACFPDSVVGFTPHEGIQSEYVLYCLRFYQEYFEHRAPKSAQMNINLDTLRTLRMPKPPEELQKEFAEFVREIRLLNNVVASQTTRHSALVNEIRIAAFTGELTANWRDQHHAEIATAAQIRDALLRERGAKLTLRPPETAPQATPAKETQLPARAWLLSELSDFQRQVFDAFIDYPDQPLLAEAPEVFARFCESEALNEKLAAFPPTSPNHLRRTLSQLAALGLIAKVALPKTNPATGEQKYLTAFRPLRPGEQTRAADVAALRRSLGLGTADEEAGAP